MADGAEGRAHRGGCEMSAHEPADYHELLRRTLIYRPASHVELPPVPSVADDGASAAEQAAAIPPEILGAAAALEPSLSLLSQRAGTAFVRHLLERSSLFWPLPNDSLLQLAGPAPVRFSTSRPAENQHVQPGKRARSADPVAAIGTSDAGCRVPHVALESREAGASPRKRPRLSSWRRRRLKHRESTEPHVREPAEAAASPPLQTPPPPPRSSPPPSPLLQLPSPPHVQQPAMPPGGQTLIPSRRKLRKLLRRLLCRHRRCSYHMLLRRHVAGRLGTACGGGAEWPDVKRYAWAVCASVLPEGILGGRDNVREMVRAAMRTALPEALASKRLTLPSSATARLRTTSVSAPSRLVVAAGGHGPRGRGPAHHHAQRRRLRSLSAWFTTRVLLPSARRVFIGRSPLRHPEPHQIDAWPKGYWKRSAKLHCRSFKRTSLHPLAPAHAAALLGAEGRELGAAALSLVPKGSGAFRTISNLNVAAPLPSVLRPVTTADAHRLGINAHLAHLLPLLSSLHGRLPSAFATSLLGMAEAQARWRVFVAERRQLAPSAPVTLRSSDLTGCFDTLAQPRLFQSIAFALRLLRDGTSLHRRFTLFRPASQALAARTVTYVQSAQQAAFAASSRYVSGVAGGAAAAAAAAVAGGSGGGPGGGGTHACVLREKELATGLAGEDALRLLRQHVFCHLIESSGRYYVARMGIPQGSVLSAWLCSLHLAAAEHAILARYLPMASGLEATAPTTLASTSDEASASALQLQLQLRVIDDTLEVKVGGSGAGAPVGQQTFGCVHNAAKARATYFLADAARSDGSRYPGGAVVQAVNGGVGRRAAKRPHASSSSGSGEAGAGSCVPDDPTGVSEGGNATGAVAGPRRGDAATVSEAARGGDAAATVPEAARGDAAASVQDGCGRTLHPWCGWLINAQTLELRPDLLRGRLAAARDRRARDGRAPPPGSAALVRALFRALRPKLHPAFADPQVNSSLTTRRNLHHAFLHALLAARADVLRGRPAPLCAALQQFFRCAAAFSRAQQRRAAGMPPHGRASSTPFAACEVDFLGWAAAATLAHHRPATLGRRAVRKAIARRLGEARRRCAHLGGAVVPLLKLACDGAGLASSV